ncbi:hypothetical protein [Rhodococcus sp. NPDC003348]
MARIKKAEALPSNSVEFVDADGVRRWGAIDSPAYLASLKAAPPPDRVDDPDHAAEPEQV